jgi:acyl-CoA thioesterase-1
MARFFLFSRRLILAALAGLLIPCAAAAATRPVVTVLGDSITAGYGLRAADAMPARLQALLGPGVLVRAAGVSGDTTAGGLARVDFSVQPDTTLCIVALGGNDLLQGLDPRQMEANLKAIVQRLKARKIKVVLAGASSPFAASAAYRKAFDGAVARVAAAEQVALAPDVLKGISDNPALRQADGLHPNPDGAKLMASRLAPVVQSVLKSPA